MQDVIETAKIVSVLGSDIVKLHSLILLATQYCPKRMKMVQYKYVQKKNILNDYLHLLHI